MIITSRPKPGLRCPAVCGLFLLAFAAASLAAPRTVLVMGDSISAAYGMARSDGWVALLAERLQQSHPEVEVVNASVSGETSGGGLERLPKLLAQHNPDVLVLELGGNDGLRGYPLTQLRDNLSDMVELARNTGAQVVLLPMEIPPNYGPRYTTGFREVYAALSATEGVLSAPFPLRDIATRPTLMQDDGIHPTAAAQPMILETIMPTLREALQP